MKTELNDRIEIEFPETFRTMSETEMRQQPVFAGDRIAVMNEEYGMVISVGWTDPLNILMRAFFSERTLLDRYYKKCRKAFKGFRKDEAVTKKVGGRAANGFAFSCAAGQGSRQHGAVVAFKADDRIYAVGYVTGCTDTLYCNMAYDMVLGSIRITDNANK